MSPEHQLLYQIYQCDCRGQNTTKFANPSDPRFCLLVQDQLVDIKEIGCKPQLVLTDKGLQVLASALREQMTAMTGGKMFGEMKMSSPGQLLPIPYPN